MTTSRTAGGEEAEAPAKRVGHHGTLADYVLIAARANYVTEKPGMRLSFDDPKPDDKRKMQQIFLRPSLRAEIEKRRGKLSRSAWIERAIFHYLRTDKL